MSDSSCTITTVRFFPVRLGRQFFNVLTSVHLCLILAPICARPTMWLDFSKVIWSNYQLPLYAHYLLVRWIYAAATRHGSIFPRLNFSEAFGPAAYLSSLRLGNAAPWDASDLLKMLLISACTCVFVHLYLCISICVFVDLYLCICVFGQRCLTCA